jgi:hypothetical protein
MRLALSSLVSYSAAMEGNLKMNRKILAPLAAVGALLIAGAANAGFVIVNNSAPAVSTVSPIPTNNDFRSQLIAAGVTQFSLGGVLSLTPGALGAGNYAIDIDVFAAEAGILNRFTYGAVSYTAPGNLSWAMRRQGTISGPAGGVLPFEFCATSISRCLTNTQNDATQFGSEQSIGMWVSEDGNTAWLLWDDSGASFDDNHDDLIVRLTYRVPEPATLGLLGLGLLGVGAVRRKRRAA